MTVEQQNPFESLPESRTDQIFDQVEQRRDAPLGQAPDLGQARRDVGEATRLRISPGNGLSRPPLKKKVTWASFSVSAA